MMPERSPETSDFTLTKDMAVTRESFFRGLPAAMIGRDYETSGLVVTSGTPEERIEITLKPLPARVLGGLMKIERSEVTLVFRGISESAREEFLDRFDRAYQRGGG